MKIALMTNNYKPVMGGVPISIERLAKGLREMGNEVTIFAPTYKNEEQEEGVFRYKTLFNNFYGGTVVPYAMDPNIEREFKENHYEVIHVHHPVLIGREAAYLSKKYGIPLVFTYHTRYEQYLNYVGLIKKVQLLSKKNGPTGMLAKRMVSGVENDVMPAIIRSFCKKCDGVLAPTPGIGSYLETDCGVEKEKLSVLPTGLDKEAYESSVESVKEIRNRYIKDGGFLFVSVSRISHEKNILFLIDAVEALKKRTNMPFKLIFAGDGPKQSIYADMCKERGISEIEFLGRVENSKIKDYCRASDAFLFASKSETQGIVIIEALAVGTPVIAVDASGVRDVVLNGVNGILTSESVEEYADKLYSYMRGDIDIDTMSDNAVNTALLYKEEAVARKATAIYESAIERHNAEMRGKYGRKVPYFVS